MPAIWDVRRGRGSTTITKSEIPVPGAVGTEIEVSDKPAYISYYLNFLDRKERDTICLETQL